MFAWIFLSFRNEVPVIELDQNWRIFSCWRIPYHVHDCYHQQVIKWVLGTYQSPKAIPLKYNDINSKLFLFFFQQEKHLNFEVIQNLFARIFSTELEPQMSIWRRVESILALQKFKILVYIPYVKMFGHVTIQYKFYHTW